MEERVEISELEGGIIKEQKLVEHVRGRQRRREIVGSEEKKRDLAVMRRREIGQVDRGGDRS
jgi:hypothetical protein